MIDLPKNEYKKSNNCPYCKYHANAAMNPDNEKEKPTPGALSVCIRCAKTSVFDEGMSLIPFDMNSLDEEDHAHVVRLQYNIHGVRGVYSKKH